MARRRGRENNISKVRINRTSGSDEKDGKALSTDDRSQKIGAALNAITLWTLPEKV
jgi:hypothetical protein